jgi:DEAD/DEAH box helicase domain-containing protein
MTEGKKQIALDFSAAESVEGVAEGGKRIVVFDLETQKGADEVGGWNNTHLMRVAVGVAHDSSENRYITYLDEKVGDLLALLKSADLVVGYNSRRFDYGVLKGYTDEPLAKTLPTLDILERVEKSLGFRLKLDNIAQTTLGISKNADGLQSLRWFKEGKIDLIAEYCEQDVKVTRDIYLYGLENGFLYYRDRNGKKTKFEIDLAPIG